VETTSVAKSKSFLFVCKDNDSRSQMAEGFARSMATGTVKVFSAGVKPKGLNQYAVDVMNELGIDITEQDTRKFTDVPVNKIDTVVTLSSDSDPLPTKLNKKATQIHWPLTDPMSADGSDAEVKKAFRSVRDEIRNRVQVLLVG
jgi:arsenate reductase